MLSMVTSGVLCVGPFFVYSYHNGKYTFPHLARTICASKLYLSQKDQSHYTLPRVQLQCLLMAIHLLFYLVITGSVSMEYVVDETEIRILAFQDVVSIFSIMGTLYQVSSVWYPCIFIMCFLLVNDIGS